MLEKPHNLSQRGISKCQWSKNLQIKEKSKRKTTSKDTSESRIFRAENTHKTSKKCDPKMGKMTSYKGEREKLLIHHEVKTLSS